jgi:hypothetical protein
VKRKLQMKTRMYLSLLLLAAVVPGALAAADEAETKAHSRRDSVLVSPLKTQQSRMSQQIRPLCRMIPNKCCRIMTH